MSDTPPQGLSVRCPTCYAEPGQNCHQPTGPDNYSCANCGARAGEDCRQQAVCHRSRRIDADLAAKRASAKPRRVTRPTLGSGSRPSPNGKPPSALQAGGRSPWLLVPEAGSETAPLYEVHLHADEYAKNVTVQVSDSAWDTIVRDLTVVDGLVESGGVLLGHRRPNSLLVTDAGRHGENSRRTRTSLQPDHLHDIQLALELGKATGVSELGYWHSHLTAGSDRPSGPDLQSMVGRSEVTSRWWPPARSIGLIVTAPQTPSYPRGDWSRPELHGWISDVGDREVPRARAWWRVVRVSVERHG